MLMDVSPHSNLPEISHHVDSLADSIIIIIMDFIKRPILVIPFLKMLYILKTEYKNSNQDCQNISMGYE